MNSITMVELSGRQDTGMTLHVNTLHQMACFEEPEQTTRHPSWNCIANVLFTTVFSSLLHGQPVDIVDNIRYLGLTISADLSWSKHILKISPPKQGN